MNAFLWTLQILFGVLFFVHGLMLTLQPAAMRGTLEQLPYPKGFLWLALSAIQGASRTSRSEGKRALPLSLVLWTNSKKLR